MTGTGIFIILLCLLTAIITYIVIACNMAKKQEKENWIMKFWKKPVTKSIVSSLVAIACGIIIGCIILLAMAGKTIGSMEISQKSGIEGLQLIILGVFNTGRNEAGTLIYGFNGKNIGDMLFTATPVLLTGLSVAIAFKTGLFNIGAPGQFLMGTAFSLIIALSIPTTAVPAWIVWTLAFLGGFVGGALWGIIPGIFKAFLNVNEVITCIMLNWIAANLVTWMFNKSTGPFNYLLNPSADKNNAVLFTSSHNGVATSKMGLDFIFKNSQINGGIIIAIIIAVLVYIIMNKTTFGYQLKACGSNRNAAKYAGINEKKSIMISMAIAGGLAGLGAALYYLSGNTEFHWETYQSLPVEGFNGIPIALLAMNNPIGVVFSSVFMAYLNVAGKQLKYMTSYNEYITDIIAAVIVYFSAFSLLIKNLLSGKVHFTGLKKLWKKFKSLFKKKETDQTEEIITNNDIVKEEHK